MHGESSAQAWRPYGAAWPTIRSTWPPRVAPRDLLALEEALQQLTEVDATAAQLVSLRFFAGLTIPQAAELMNLSARTADRLWAYARAFLHAEISSEK